MRKWIAMPAAVAAALCFASAAVADDAASVKKQIDASFNKTMAAFKKHDIKGVMADTADDYEGVGANGQKVDKAGAEAMMKQYMKETKKINSAKFTVSGLKVQGNTATGKTTFNLDAMVVDSEGTMGPKGKSHHMQVEQYTNVTWTKTGGSWKTRKEVPSGMPKMMLDGKPFNPGAPPPPKKK